ncbi:hypothetical protein OGAPHI_003452 [Ogataea philodendri]|uniref:Endonuclease/exonuclease/phosphatase domain-containing protein n=1 Tax=Ogataea philodendri TaxID=1378263 RepID=A0A9P8T5Z5_9ASCO|nr:uncharacterized protein OGAPHI_003452 [Ogataea philodendri]KAH3666456.1 hypothetical protein OGAPHI_003452 [Ogataea philodendri]
MMDRVFGLSLREKMLGLAVLSCLVVLFNYPQATVAQETNLRIQSWNLRYDSKPNDITVQQTIEGLNSTLPIDVDTKWFSNYTEQPWSSRRIGVKNEVQFNNPEIFTVNEGLHRQVEDLKELLGYPYIGVGRDDGGEAGEYEAVFYNPHALEVVSNDTFWLSDTPFEPSKYPGAGSYRSATVVHFRSLDTGSTFVLINAHLDDQSDDQRKLGAALVKYRAAYEVENKHVPVIFVGDFNSQVTGDSDGAYLISTGQQTFSESDLNSTFTDKYSNSLTDFNFLDILEETPAENRMGNLATFTGFKDTTSGFSRIDFQFASNTTDWEAVRFKVGDNWYDDSFYLSDHRPVISDIVLN